MVKRFVLLFFISIGMLFNQVCFGEATNADTQTLEIPQLGVSIVPASIAVKEAVPFSESTETNMLQWDLTSSDKDCWHYARVIFYREDKERGSLDMMEYVDLKEPLLGMISDLAKGAIEKYAANSGVSLLKWYPAQKSPISKKNGIMFAAQVVPTAKLPLPMYAAIHVFVQEKRLCVLAFLCPDSDKGYWLPNFSQMAASFK